MNNVGKSVKVYWSEDDQWFSGMIDEYNEKKGYHIQYYDGDDEWLTSLKDVQFKNEEDEDDGDGEQQNQYEETKDQPEFQSYQEDNEYNINNLNIDEDENKEDLNNTQTSNKRRADSEDIPEDYSVFSNIELNDNGILLKGVVTGANNLPLRNSVSTTENNSEEGIFYRILYVEGGGSNSMFRCKTPIYKSENSVDLEYPRWNEEPFRFEMVLPGDSPPLNFSQLGEVIIALYKLRRNGGSDFIAQVSISIQDFLRIGSVAKGRPGNECRILRGSYVLVDKRGKMLGGGADIDINLRLEWKNRTPQLPSQQLPQKLTSNGSVSGTSKRSSSTTRPKSANSTETTNNNNSKRSTSSGRNGTSYRNARQQSVIEKENEAMRQRLEKAGPKKIGSMDRVGVIREVYRPQSNEISTKQMEAKKRNDSRLRSVKASSSSSSSEINGNGNIEDEQESKRGGLSTGGGISISTATLSKKSYSELLKIYEDLKLKLSKDQKTLMNNKTQLNKMKSQMEKQESLVERMKKIELQANKGNKLNEKDNPIEVNTYTVEEILTRNGLSENEEEISDQVLRELIVEHSTLQQTRMTLVERLKKFSQQTEEVNKETKQLKNEVDTITETLRESVNKTQNNNWNLHQLKRLTKLQQTQQEYENLKEKKKMECLCGSVHDTISNCIEQIKLLDKLIETKNTSLDKILYDSENWKVKLDDLQQENLIGKMRNSVNLMRGSLFRLERQGRLAGIKSETDAIELEVLRCNLNHQILLTK